MLRLLPAKGISQVDHMHHTNLTIFDFFALICCTNLKDSTIESTRSQSLLVYNGETKRRPKNWRLSNNGIKLDNTIRVNSDF